MILKKFYAAIITIFVFHYSLEVKFRRTILAVGFPYYKILMSLGNCSERVIFVDHKIWGNVKLNRILDIYYKSENSNYKVSKVEIKMVINNTDCYAESEHSVGYPEFTATIYLPTKVGVMFYSLTVFTCDVEKFERNDENQNNDFKENINLWNLLPFYSRKGLVY